LDAISSAAVFKIKDFSRNMENKFEQATKVENKKKATTTSIPLANCWM